VLLSGEPGIGKSRLSAALLERLAGESHIRMRYFCSPQHTGSALHPIIGHMERAAGFAREDDARTRLDKLDALLGHSATSREDVTLLAEMLSLPNDGRYPALDLAPQERRRRILQALLGAAFGGRRPEVPPNGCRRPVQAVLTPYNVVGFHEEGNRARSRFRTANLSSDAFVNFSPFEGRGDANGDRPERAEFIRPVSRRNSRYRLDTGLSASRGNTSSPPRAVFQFSNSNHLYDAKPPSRKPSRRAATIRFDHGPRLRPGVELHSAHEPPQPRLARSAARALSRLVRAPNRRLGLRVLRPTQTTCRCSDKAAPWVGEWARPAPLPPPPSVRIRIWLRTRIRRFDRQACPLAPIARRPIGARREEASP
jgi:hypothetical protein